MSSDLSKGNNMLSLHQDCKWNIFRNLEVWDAVNFSEVNKEANRFINSSQQLWDLFAEMLKIKATTSSQESVKKFFAASFGVNEAEIKKEASKDLRRLYP
jgi:hypothetical protein